MKLLMLETLLYHDARERRQTHPRGLIRLIRLILEVMVCDYDGGCLCLLTVSTTVVKESE